jgi:fibronectin type 3 domain-containing protein
LTLRLTDRGGPSPWVVINGLQIERAPLPFRFDFGTATSPVATGYTQVTEATGYSAGQGYGWRSGAIESRDRGPGSDGQNRNALVRDLNRTTDGTFAVDLANGTYTVTVTMGDGWHDMDLVAVFLEGVKVDTVSTLDDEFAVRTYTVRVTDGQLTLRLKDLGGADPNAVINALVIR